MGPSAENKVGIRREAWCPALSRTWPAGSSLFSGGESDEPLRPWPPTSQESPGQRHGPGEQEGC